MDSFRAIGVIMMEGRPVELYVKVPKAPTREAIENKRLIKAAEDIVKGYLTE